MKKFQAILLIVVIFIGGGVFLYTKNSHSIPKQFENQFSSASTEKSDAASQLGNSSTANEKEVRIDISGYSFMPAKVTIKPGTVVTWKNRDAVMHDISPEEDYENFKVSDLLAKGQSHSVTFTEPGEYTYRCNPHPYMKGTIVVEDT